LEKFSKIKGSNTNISCIGNLKFYFEEKNPEFKIDEEFKNKTIAFCSSSHNPEEKMFLNALEKSGADFDKIIIAPRHLNRVQDIENLLQSKNIGYSLYSSKNYSEKYIILDEFGLLEQFYSISCKIFIGGSTEGTGGHNIFEALQFEKIPATGSQMNNFKEIFELAKKYNLIKITDDETSLSKYFIEKNEKYDFKPFFDELKQYNKSTETIVKLIKEIVNG